jgi:hypothetical protein
MKRNFQKMEELFQTNPNITIDTMNWNNDDCIAYSAARKLDKKAIKFCIKHKSNKLSYACAMVYV